MSLAEIKNIQYETKTNKSSSLLGHNSNTSIYSQIKFSKNLRDSDAKDYIFNKKRKTNNRNPSDKNKNNLNYKNEEAKSLFLEKSEVLYPLNNDRKIINNKSYYNGYYNRNKHLSLDNNNNTTPIKVNRYLKDNKESFNNNYSSRILNEVQNLKIKNNLIKNHRNNSKRNNIMRNIKKSKSKQSNHKTNNDSNGSFNRSDNSTLILPHIFGVNSLKNSIERKKKNYTINTFNPKKDINNIKYSYDFNKKKNIKDKTVFKIQKILNDINSDDEFDKNIKINNYDKASFINHINIFYKLYLHKTFNHFLFQIKHLIKNKKYHFENKSIKNISGLIKKIKSNPFYYGSKRLSTIILEEINIENSKNSNTIDYENNYKENDTIDLNEEKKKKRLLIKMKYGNNKKYKIDNENKTKEDNLTMDDKKYFRKKVVQNNKKKEIIFSMDFKNNYIENESDGDTSKRMNEIYDLNELINNCQDNNDINKLYNSNIISTEKMLNKPKTFKKASVHNSFNKTNNNKITDKSQQEDKNDLQIYDILKGEKKDRNKNMDKDYNLKIGNKNQIQNNFIIDNNINYTMNGKRSKEKSNDRIISNNNFKNAITIITKILENKQKEEKINKLKLNSLLLIIIQNIEDKKNLELIKKYFHILKNNKNNIKNSSSNRNSNNWLDLKQNNGNELLFKKKLFNNKNNLNKTRLNKTCKDNQSISMSGSGSEIKYGVVTEKYNRKTINYKMKKKRPIKISKKNISLLFGTNKTLYRKKSIEIEKIYDNGKSITTKGYITFNNSLSINSTINKEINDLSLKSEKNMLGSNENKKINIRKTINAIGSFRICKKNKDLLNKRNNDKKKEKDNIWKKNINNTLNEKYHDYENLIYYLRIKLILYAISKKKYNEFYND